MAAANPLRKPEMEQQRPQVGESDIRIRCPPRTVCRRRSCRSMIGHSQSRFFDSLPALTAPRTYTEVGHSPTPQANKVESCHPGQLDDIASLTREVPRPGLHTRSALLEQFRSRVRLLNHVAHLVAEGHPLPPSCHTGQFDHVSGQPGREGNNGRRDGLVPSLRPSRMLHALTWHRRKQQAIQRGRPQGLGCAWVPPTIAECGTRSLTRDIICPKVSVQWLAAAQA